VRTVAVYSLKGGVGKTSTAVNLAYLAARAGIPTILWDLDPQAAATWYLQSRTPEKLRLKRLIRGKTPIGELITATDYERLDLIPSDLSYRKLDLLLDQYGSDDRRLAELIEPLSEDYGLTILDCPPSITRVSDNVFHAADLILSPVLPAPQTVEVFQTMVRYLARQKIKGVKLYPFLSMVDRRKALHRRQLDGLRDSIRTLLETWIPYASAMEQMTLRRAPLPHFDGRSPAALATEDLWRELRVRLAID
jgi:cellulose biosynthesis protein BcsQ